MVDNFWCDLSDAFDDIDESLLKTKLNANSFSHESLKLFIISGVTWFKEGLRNLHLDHFLWFTLMIYYPIELTDVCHYNSDT